MTTLPPVEIEAKFGLESHAAVRARLVELGATFISRVLETNSIYDRFPENHMSAPRIGMLRQAGTALRVRSVQVLEGEAQAATITFKGPVEVSAFKKREELELPLADAEGMRRLLTAVGFVEVLRFPKRRESWRLSNCRVELDELPRLGCFVEIEGPDESTIHAAREVLGLGNAEEIKLSYVALIADAFAEEIAQHGIIAFEPS